MVTKSGRQLSVAATGMASEVVTRLFQEYYEQGRARAVGASSYWLDASGRFAVDLNASGEVKRLEGYAFGAIATASLKQRVLTECFVATQVARLKLSGIHAAVAAGRRTIAAMGLDFSQDSFRQVATATLLGPYILTSIRQEGLPLTILVIGDGPGTLSALLHSAFPNARIWLVDLGPTLLFQAVYLSRAFPDVPHSLAGDPSSSDAAFVYCPAEHLDRLPPGDIHFAVNVASMQEMGPETVIRYFSFIRGRGTRFFYCCNRLDKRLPAGEVSRFFDYPWRDADVHIIDEACPWHQWFLGNSASPNVRLAGIPLPLVHEYDGVHWHRLSRLDHCSVV